MADITVNLDRAVEMKLKYPLGVTETLKITFEDEVTLIDSFSIVITKRGTIIDTILDTDAALTKTSNYLSWVINYDEGGLLCEGVYDYYINNITNDYKIFTGEITIS